MLMYFFLKRIITYLRLYLSSINQGDPQIQKLFAKSDNASCYHGNYLPQALYQLCKEQDIMLVRYDYNEPCKGKDQCDCECVGLKTILKSYVDSVNNVECANDIFIALNQSKGLKNTKIAVIETDKAKPSLSGDTTPNICSYHFIQFSADCIIFWRYFDVGEGIIVPHSNVNFLSGEIIKSYFL